jgi:hypothetical protein
MREITEKKPPFQTRILCLDPILSTQFVAWNFLGKLALERVEFTKNGVECQEQISLLKYGKIFVLHHLS